MAMDQRRTANPAKRPSEIEGAARELLDLIYDPSHGHLHLAEGNDGDYAPKAGEAARRLADALGYRKGEYSDALATARKRFPNDDDAARRYADDIVKGG